MQIDFPAFLAYNKYVFCCLKRGMMDFKRAMHRFPIFSFLFIFFFVFACSTPSWFPTKKGPPHKAKSKELLDKEVIIIDKEEYVKVLNPKASEGGNQPKYLYIPVNEYLSKREAFVIPVARKEEPKKETSALVKPSLAPAEKEVYSVSQEKSFGPTLKKKVVITHFDDRTIQGEELLGDWVAEKLVSELDRRSPRVLFVDYQLVKEFLEAKGIPLTDLETPNVLRLLNEAFGIHALIFGQLSGPYAFATKGGKDQEVTASAIIKIEMRLTDTLSGKTLKNLSATNPIVATKVQGSFPEERAKVKAIDVTVADLSRSLSRELDGLNWFCRIAKVEGEDVYLNAGRLTGIKVGDEMEVFRSEGRGEIKGKIRILSCFGVDASIGRLVNGKRPEMDDILRLAKREGA